MTQNHGSKGKSYDSRIAWNTKQYFGGRMVNKDTGVADLDSEWMQLILEALELGIEKKEIRDFLNSRSTEAIVPVVLEN